MYHLLKNLVEYVFLTVFLFIVQILISYILPYPFNQVNFIFIFFLWKVVYQDKLLYLWLIIPTYFIFSLFTSVSFGVLGLTIFCSIILAKQIFLIWFSTYSWYSFFLLGLVGFSLNYAFLTFFTALVPLLFGDRVSYQVSEIYYLLIEIFLNAACFFLFYGTYNILKPRRKYNYTF
ncbi:MAG: hypothetical protein WC725_00730 [Patescibacteria group bacterium]|jgi:hypothetical protein